MSILAIVVATLLISAAIRQAREPDLHRLYMQNSMVTDQPPVVFIHGIMGSKLRNDDSGEELWPGPVHKLFGTQHKELVMGFDPTTFASRAGAISAYAVARNAAGRDFYGKILYTL
ncbi:MAG: hypothetical protein ACR2P9_00155, partial [Gammaproteobacteria bacterium]